MMRYSSRQLEDIYDKTGGRCYYCRKKLTWHNYGKSGESGAWEVDHSNPAAIGETYYMQDLVPLCIDCSRSRRAKVAH